MSMVPIVIEQTNRGERSYDIFSRLLNDRIIVLSDVINDTTASIIIAQMLFLEAADPDRDMERDYFMTAEEAKEYGLIDEVMVKK